MKTKSKLDFLINILFYGTVFIIIYFSIKFLFAYLLPFILGTIITIIVQKPATTISNKIKLKKGYCALILVIAIYLLIILLSILLIFEAGVYIYNLATGDNYIFTTIREFFDNMISNLQTVLIKIPDYILSCLTTTLRNLFDSVIVIFTDFSKSVIKAAPMFITSSVVTIIASCYIAKDYDRFKDSIKSVVSTRYKQALLIIKRIFKDNVSKVIIGYSKILLITFLELAIGLLLLKADNFIIYAALIAFLDLLPVIGTGTVLIPWGIYSIFTENYYFGIGLLILYAIIMIVRNIIEPKIIGKQIGLHPLIALISVFIGLKIFGFIGIFLVPFSVMFIYKMFNEGVFDLLFSKA